MTNFSDTQPIPVIASLAQLKQGGRLLDLGCGDGRHAIHFAKHGFKVTAVDHDAGALDRLEEAAHIEDVESRITLVHKDVAGFLRQEDRWDVIILSLFLHEVPMPIGNLIIKRAQHLTEPGGWNGFAVWLDEGDFAKRLPTQPMNRFLPTYDSMHARYEHWQKALGGVALARGRPDPGSEFVFTGRIHCGLCQKL
ncbi:methyltransferase domain-containing protein [Patescibacteria group bacterium]|jgi:SAM-dependent methyltransferase|nr:methyltransferase domain-containing protein [Patescibacteria group bacterium]